MGLLVALISVGAFASLATAHPRRTVIVRDGVYAGQGPHNTSVLFYVRGRRVYHPRFVILISCRDASGPIGDRWFAAGAGMPQGEPIPTGGLKVRNWNQVDAQRLVTG